MKKSKGIKFKQWSLAVYALATERQLRKYVTAEAIEPLYHNDISVKSVFDHIYITIEDAENDRVLVIYPLSKRNKYSRLPMYKGYSERLTNTEEMVNKKHCIPIKNERQKKDKTTPLFGDMPECKKSI